MPVFDAPVYEEPNLTTKMTRYERVLTPLMDSPGTWGKIGEYKSTDSAYQAALNLRNGRYQIPGEPEDWEFVRDGHEVYARYVRTSGTKKVAKKATKKKE